MAGLGVSSLQLVLLASLLALGASATIPELGQLLEKEPGTENIAADSSTNPEGVVPLASRFYPGLGLSRTKRYIGWGRKPGLRYSKANWDFDTSFNKLFNKYEKRQDVPDAPVSHFRELKMKQKVPNVQILLPHLFNRNNRFTEDATQGGSSPDVVELTEEDVEALLYLLEEYAAKHGRPTEQ